MIDGTEYPSMRQVAKELGVEQSTLMNRIKAGISVKDALSGAHSEHDKLKGNPSLSSTKESSTHRLVICCLLILHW